MVRVGVRKQSQQCVDIQRLQRQREQQQPQQYERGPLCRALSVGESTGGMPMQGSRPFSSGASGPRGSRT